MSDERELATVELLGALTYGQLRAFQVSAHALRLAPDIRRADRLAELAAQEYAAYTALRDELASRTDLTVAVLERQRDRFDAYFDAVPIDDWLGACVFFAVGLPIAADFAQEISPTLDPQAAAVIGGTLAGRGAFERFALTEVGRYLGDDGERDRARHLVADILGKALTSFQGALTDTDALRVLFRTSAETQGVSAEALVKRMAISVLEGHRRRMHALGLEELD